MEDYLFINEHGVMTYCVDGQCFTSQLDLRWHLVGCGFDLSEQLQFIRGLKRVYATDGRYRYPND